MAKESWMMKRMRMIAGKLSYLEYILIAVGHPSTIRTKKAML
jgi:hypothetical protein